MLLEYGLELEHPCGNVKPPQTDCILCLDVDGTSVADCGHVCLSVEAENKVDSL